MAAGSSPPAPVRPGGAAGPGCRRPTRPRPRRPPPRGRQRSRRPRPSRSAAGSRRHACHAGAYVPAENHPPMRKIVVLCLLVLAAGLPGTDTRAAVVAEAIVTFEDGAVAATGDLRGAGLREL